MLYKYVMEENADMSNDHVTEMLRRDQALMDGRRAGYEWGYSEGWKHGAIFSIAVSFLAAVVILVAVAVL